MIKGYNGKILFVHLTSGSVKEEDLPEKVYRDYIGGQGLGARILYERMKPKADPLGPDNILGFVAGPLTGTGIHGSRYQLVAKSPVTGGWGDANSGGYLAREIKAAGYDGIFVTGLSAKPVYLFIRDGKTEIKDASHLWGKDTTETDKMLRDELADEDVRIACIGPAGENKALLACVRHEGCAAGRSGLGAVMGSKHLKALVVRGSQKVSMADPKRFEALRREYLNDVKNTTHSVAITFRDYGTCGTTTSSIVIGDTPIKNWSLYGEEGLTTHARLSGDAVIKYQVKKHFCSGCPVGCKGWIDQGEGRYAVRRGSKLEYETITMMGSNCMIDDLDKLNKANDLCNRFGLDTIGTGATIAFAMECYENGLITKKDTGIELKWGDADAFIAMLEKMNRREGFGDILADGSKRAADHIGKGSEKYAMHIGGQDVPAHDPRVSTGFGWGYICDPTPARHTCSLYKHFHDGRVPFVLGPDLRLPDPDPADAKANAPLFAICSALDRFWTSAGLCIFALVPETMPVIEAMSAVTGWNYTIDEAITTGRRIQTLRQAFNFREGVSPNQWVLPERLSRVADFGPFAGKKVDFKTMREVGWKALGWDPKTGRPLDSTLQELGLEELVVKLP